MDESNMNTAANFPAKSRVRYTGKALNARGFAYHGQLATVIRPIKSRKVVHIQWDLAGEASFEANPNNLELLLDNPEIVRNIIEIAP